MCLLTESVRCVQRQKEILRNKKERRFQRDAHALIQADPDAIKEELKGVSATADRFVCCLGVLLRLGCALKAW